MLYLFRKEESPPLQTLFYFWVYFSTLCLKSYWNKKVSARHIINRYPRFRNPSKYAWFIALLIKVHNRNVFPDKGSMTLFMVTKPLIVKDRGRKKEGGGGGDTKIAGSRDGRPERKYHEVTWQVHLRIAEGRGNPSHFLPVTPPFISPALSISIFWTALYAHFFPRFVIAL